MPLFSKKFPPVNLPSRKKLGFHSNTTTNLTSKSGVKLLLGNEEYVFEKGHWVPVSGEKGDVYKENESLKEYARELREENNLLKIKRDILLDMLTEVTCEAEMREREIIRLRTETAKKNRR